jgi:hypothetical protein
MDQPSSSFRGPAVSILRLRNSCRGRSDIEIDQDFEARLGTGDLDVEMDGSLTEPTVTPSSACYTENVLL